MPVTLTIDGLEVQAQPGTTVLDAALAHNIDIPRLCHSPKLRPLGSCRLCVVEIENMRGYPSACTVPVTEGLVVHTETDTLNTMRRETLSLILAEHPYTCLVCKDYCGVFHSGTIRKAAVTTGCSYCPSNGRCELQTLVKRLDITDIPYPIRYRGLPLETADPFFDRDYNLCVLCGRCVQACRDLRHNSVLSFVNRGSRAVVGTAFGRSHLDAGCEFCGACVDVCPTGAMADKRSKWEGAPTATAASVCPYCAVGCNITVEVKNNKVIRTVGRPDGVTNDGQLCVRGRFGVVDVVHHLNRLKNPAICRENRRVEVSWDEALPVAAQKLAPYHGDEIAVIGSASATNEDAYLLQKFARTVLKTNNIAMAAALPEKDYADPLAAEILPAIDGASIRQVRDAACIVVIGANVFVSHPILGLEIKHALSNGASLITVDARLTRMSDCSEISLQPKIGSDYLVLAGMLKALYDQGVQIPNGDSYLHLDPTRTAAITGVHPHTVILAARRLAELKPSVIIYGSGVTHQPTARQTIRAIRALAGIGGAQVMAVPGEGNFVGAHDMGLHPALLPGYRPVAEPALRAGVELAWQTTLPDKPGLGFEAVINGIERGRIKALYLAGDMPPLPALEKLELLVVQDIVQTSHSRLAQVVLPAATFAEADGSFTNLEGRVQRVRQAISPVEQARPGWQIIANLAQAMGYAGWAYQSAAQVMAEIAAVMPAYATINLNSLETEGALRRFETSAHRPVAFDLHGLPHVANGDYPYTLITERNLQHYFGLCLSEQVSGMERIKREQVLHLNAADAVHLGVANGDPVRLVSPHGSADCVAFVVNGKLPAGIVFTSFNRANPMPLFPAATPTAKVYAVRLEKQAGQ